MGHDITPPPAPPAPPPWSNAAHGATASVLEMARAGELLLELGGTFLEMREHPDPGPARDALDQRADDLQWAIVQLAITITERIDGHVHDNDETEWRKLRTRRAERLEAGGG